VAGVLSILRSASSALALRRRRRPVRHRSANPSPNRRHRGRSPLGRLPAEEHSTAQRAPARPGLAALRDAGHPLFSPDPALPKCSGCA